MARKRDFQCAKVYKAENQVKSGSERINNLEEIQKFVDSITKSRWYKNRFKRWSKIRVADGKKFAYGWPVRGLISVPRWARTRLFILHELTHVVAPMDIPDHGKEFCALYLEFVKRWIGPHCAAELREKFKKHNVIW